MDNQHEDYFKQSMDDIVFDNRNKKYGAYYLRETYKKHLLKALGLSVGIFVFSLYTPKMGKALGIFKDKPEEKLDTTTITLSEPPSLKPDEPPPPPPPPPVEVKRPTQRFMELVAAKKEEVTEDPPKVEEVKEAGKQDIDAPDPPADAPQIFEEVADAPKEPTIYTEVDQPARFKGGPDAMQAFLDKNLKYPEDEEANGVEDKVWVKFSVDIDGTVDNVSIYKSNKYKNLDNEAMRVVRRANKMFLPGKRGGKEVKSWCILPIEFVSQSEEDY